MTGVAFKGADRARPARKVVDAIRNSEGIVIAPGNPVSSIGPMLAIAGIRRELERAREKVVAVSPIVGDSPVSGPAAKYMKALELEVSPAGVAEYYKGVVGSFVIAKTDRGMARRIERLGMKVAEADILMTGQVSENRLARFLAWKARN